MHVRNSTAGFSQSERRTPEHRGRRSYSSAMMKGLTSQLEICKMHGLCVAKIVIHDHKLAASIFSVYARF